MSLDFNNISALVLNISNRPPFALTRDGIILGANLLLGKTCLRHIYLHLLEYVYEWSDVSLVCVCVCVCVEMMHLYLSEQVLWGLEGPLSVSEEVEGECHAAQVPTPLHHIRTAAQICRLLRGRRGR